MATPLSPLTGLLLALNRLTQYQLSKDGTLFANSQQFAADFTNEACEVLKDGTTKVASIADPQQDFQTFSQKPLNWQTGFTISCTLPSSA